MSTVQETVKNENIYAGLNAWHSAGLTGKGIVIWNTEGGGSHAETVTRRIKDAAPDCDVIMAGLEMASNSDIVYYSHVRYMGEKIDTEDFIKKFGVNIVSRSIGGGTATGRAESKFWNELKDKYNLIFFNSAGNEGDEGEDSCGGALPPDVALYIAACNIVKGKPKRATYSSIGKEVDFCNFVGVWSGTSFAAPYTAGETALLKQRYGKDISQEEIFKYLCFVAEDMEIEGVDTKTGYGIPRFPTLERKYITMKIGDKRYFIDGKEMAMDTEPILKLERTFVPIRAISESLGSTVDWNGTEKKVTILYRNSVVTMTIGSNLMFVDGKKKYLDVEPFIDRNNRTLVPIRAIAEAFGCKVDWIQESQKVIILEV